LHTPARQRARIVPPTPITVAIDDVETGLCLCYGVIANVSEAGACVWTNGLLDKGAEVNLRVSFAHPPEVHEIRGTVVWEDAMAQSHAPAHLAGMRRFGVAWRETALSCVHRLRQLALRAEQPSTPSGKLRAVSRLELEG
jgi:hypothetical protein